MTGPGPDWVEQARRFVVTSGLGEVLAGGRPPGAAGGPDPEPPADHPGQGSAADHPAECRWCPVCVGMAALRGRRPDLVEGLADVLATTAAVLRAHAAAGSGSAAGRPHGDGGTTPPGEHGDPPPADDVGEGAVPPQSVPVQRIDVA